MFSIVVVDGNGTNTAMNPYSDIIFSLTAAPNWGSLEHVESNLNFSQYFASSTKHLDSSFSCRLDLKCRSVQWFHRGLS